MATRRAGSSRSCRGRTPRAPWAVLSLALVLSLVTRPASAQFAQSRIENNFGDLMRILSDLATKVGDKSRGELVDFFNRVELFNVESEIDRLVGNPWQLSDSTSYKLSLAPLHVAYPVFDQQVRQMTRLDDIRSRRIQDLTVDSLGLLTVNLDLLNVTQTSTQISNSIDQNILIVDQSSSQLSSSIVHTFNAREFLDFSVFLLAQQPFFPQTDEEWDMWKHRVATHQGLLALSVAGLGALVEAGAMSNSGTIQHCQDGTCKIGWYAGFSHLGHRLQPNLRGGLITQVPGVEFSTGLMEQVRASSDSASSVFEMAMRESFLNRFTSTSGWNSFFEAAIRRVLTVEDRYGGELFTARGGLFLKREHPFRCRYFTLRTSTEVESDMTGSLRYSMGVGVDYTKTGLSTVLQSSRTNVMRDSGLAPETRTALFVAGTVESPDAYYVEAMEVRARLLREEWNALTASEAERRQAEVEMRVLAGAQVPASRLAPRFEAIRRATAESESHRVRVATLVGDYLEGRRIAYSLKQWKKSPDDLQGPLDGEVLEAASHSVIERFAELAAFLQGARSRLEILRDRYSRASERAQATGDNSEEARNLAVDEQGEIDKTWRRDSESVSEALRLYNHYLASIRRIASIANGLMPVRQVSPLHPHLLRSLVTLVAQPLQ